MNHITPSAAFQEAMQLYETNHLPIPPLPAELTQDVVKVYEWVYGTRADVRSPYWIQPYISELETGLQPDYVVFGHAGHGIVSYALHFYLVRGPLALFLQHSWGNADSNPAKDVEYIARDYLLARKIIQAMAEAKSVRLPQQLVVYHSNLRLDSQ
jgi:hypothetical protein